MPQLVYSTERYSIDHGNRLSHTADKYEASEEEVDFSICNTLYEVLRLLMYLEMDNLHIVGTRGYVYHSLAMASFVASLINNPGLPASAYRNLTRTGGLRQRVIELVNEMKEA